MHPRALTLALVLGGCSFTFDEDAPEVALDGPAVDASASPRVRQTKDEHLLVMQGEGGAHWAALWTEPVTGYITSVRLERLTPPAASQTITGGHITLSHRFVYAYQAIDNAPAHIDVWAPGAGAPVLSVEVSKARTFDSIDSEYSNLAASWDGSVFLYYDERSAWMDLWRTDGSFHRTLPVAKTTWSKGRVRYSQPPVSFSPDGEWLAVWSYDRTRLGTRLYDGATTVDLFHTRSKATVRLPPIHGDWDFDPGGAGVTLCDEERGLLYVPLSVPVDVPEGGAQVVSLDTEPCLSIMRTIATSGQPTRLIYRHSPDLQGVVRITDTSGRMPSQVLLRLSTEDAELLDVGLAGALTSHTWDYRYIDEQATDGWLGEWRFMERGRQCYFSHDGLRFRFVDHTALEPSVGDFSSVRADTREVLRIARNVFYWFEIPDGRVVARSNRALAGYWNRIIAVDEERGRGRLVAEGNFDVEPIHDSNDLLAYRWLPEAADALEYWLIPMAPRNLTQTN